MESDKKKKFGFSSLNLKGKKMLGGGKASLDEKIAGKIGESQFEAAELSKTCSMFGDLTASSSIKKSTKHLKTNQSQISKQSDKNSFLPEESSPFLPKETMLINFLASICLKKGHYKGFSGFDSYEYNTEKNNPGEKIMEDNNLLLKIANPGNKNFLEKIIIDADSKKGSEETKTGTTYLTTTVAKELASTLQREANRICGMRGLSSNGSSKVMD